MEHLRSIALTVDENEPRQFTWMLLESQGDAVVFDVELACADAPFSTYLEALRAGFDQLRTMGSPTGGPREPGEDEGNDPVGQDVYGGNA